MIVAVEKSKKSLFRPRTTTIAQIGLFLCILLVAQNAVGWLASGPDLTYLYQAKEQMYFDEKLQIISERDVNFLNLEVQLTKNEQLKSELQKTTAEKADLKTKVSQLEAKLANQEQTTQYLKDKILAMSEIKLPLTVTKDEITIIENQGEFKDTSFIKQTVIEVFFTSAAIRNDATTNMRTAIKEKFGSGWAKSC